MSLVHVACPLSLLIFLVTFPCHFNFGIGVILFLTGTVLQINSSTMDTRTILSILLLVSSFGVVKGANILFYFGVSTYSHRIIAWPLIDALAAKGHKVSFLSPFAIKKPHPNVTDLVPRELTKLFSSFVAEDSDIIGDRFTGNTKKLWNDLPSIGLDSCDLLIKSPEWRDWIDQSQFDLVVIDALYGECGLGLAHKFKARIIYFKTNTIYPWEYDLHGLPAESSSIPDVQNAFPQDMDFVTRVKNTMIPLLNFWYHRWVYQPALEELLRKELDMPDMPSIEELQGRILLFLTNAHYSTDYARSLPPSFVPIAGLVTHTTEKQPLTREMLKFIDSAKNGFIYVSFGSAVQVSKMDPHVQQIFFNSFGNSSMKFIWKYEGEIIPGGMPSNVFTAKWMPQQGILGHPNCKGFITHGGLGSIHEAMHFGVPLIVMPIFVDQDYNAERVQRLGHGLSLEITTITQDQLEDAIGKLINDTSFKSRMHEISISFKDRQNSPLETAVWWTEKVLRSSDFELSLLSPLGKNQAWYVRRQLDVWLFLFFLIVAPITTLLIILLKITSKKASQSQKTQSTQGKKVKSN